VSYEMWFGLAAVGVLFIIGFGLILLHDHHYEQREASRQRRYELEDQIRHMRSLSGRRRRR